MGSNFKSILDYFGVKSHHELMEFIEDNPMDQKVLELKSLFLELGIDLNGKNGQ